MSLIVGSRSSGSSGPSPNTSSSSSANSVSRSARLSGVALFGQQLAEQRADLAFGARAIGLRQRLEVQAVQQLAVDVGLQLEVLLPRRRRRGADGRGGAGRDRRRSGGCARVLMGIYQMDAMRRGRAGCVWRLRPLAPRRPRVENLPREADRTAPRCRSCRLSASGTPELSAVDTVL